MTPGNISRFNLCLAALAATCLLASSSLTPLAAQEQSPKPGATSQIRVDVNSADVKALETLPGIGPVLAQRIFEGRPYKTLADLEKVKGLGAAKVAALSASVTFGTAIVTSKPTPRPVSTNIAKSTSASIAPRNPSSPATNQTRSQDARNTRVTPVTAAPDHPAVGRRTNLNKATAEELERLPGIGPAKARAIIDYRSQNGDFKTIESLQQVKGIKEGTFSKLKELITVAD